MFKLIKTLFEALTDLVQMLGNTTKAGNIATRSLIPMAEKLEREQLAELNKQADAIREA
jgi:hypothetical protein